MSPALRVLMVGTGYWSRFQLAAWGEIDEARVVGICGRSGDAATALAAEVGGVVGYGDLEQAIQVQRPDVVDVVTSPESHRQVVEQALGQGCAVICQKPLATTLEEAERMAAAAAAAGRPLLVHENFRWQAPIRAVSAALASGAPGRPFRARIEFCSSFPVFDNQPALRDAERFILMDVGTHQLDVARFLFGEARSVTCRTASVTPGIAGEDVATVLLDQEGLHTTVHLSYASRLPDERFPETRIAVECTEGSVILGPGNVLELTTRDGVERTTAAPARYPWADPQYDLVHASIVPCHRHLVAALRGETRAETDVEDNLRTLRLVFAAYRAAEECAVVLV